MNLPDKMPSEMEKEFKAKIKEMFDKYEKAGLIKRKKEPRVQIYLELTPNEDKSEYVVTKSTINEIWR